MAVSKTRAVEIIKEECKRRTTKTITFGSIKAFGHVIDWNCYFGKLGYAVIGFPTDGLPHLTEKSFRALVNSLIDDAKAEGAIFKMEWGKMPIEEVTDA